MALHANGSDLNCTAPEQVALTLVYVANQYREDAASLAHQWQDEWAGLVWTKLAEELEDSAKRCEAIVTKYFK